jgi:hypothetical protein
MGGFAGLYQVVRATEEHWWVHPLGEREILVVSQLGSCSGQCATQTRRTMEQHGVHSDKYEPFD